MFDWSGIVLFDQFLVDTEPRALLLLNVIDLLIAFLIVTIVCNGTFPRFWLQLTRSIVILCVAMIIIWLHLLMKWERRRFFYLFLCSFGVELGEQIGWKVFPCVYKHRELFELVKGSELANFVREIITCGGRSASWKNLSRWLDSRLHTPWNKVCDIKWECLPSCGIWNDDYL